MLYAEGAVYGRALFSPAAAMHLSALYRYPVKSAGAESLTEAAVQLRGLAGDRRWMVVDADGRFLTGRQHHHLVQMRAQHLEGGVRLTHPVAGVLEVGIPDAGGERQNVTVWDDTVDAIRCTAAASRYLGQVLGQEAHLVYMDAAATRAVDLAYAQLGDQVSFADGYPLLLISQEALDQLNARASHPVSMLRFRPNLVVQGCAPHAEDRWRRIRIGEVEFELAKACVRCVFTTLDPDSGAPDPEGEPLRTLKAYRRSPKGITFGQNLIPRGTGKLRLGDPVALIEQLL